MAAAGLRTPALGSFLVVALATVLAVFLQHVCVSGRRTLSAACPACSSSAGSTCASQSAADIQRYQSLLQASCGSYSPDSCCGLRHSGSWESVSACACAGEVASGVQMVVVEKVCGCAAASDRSRQLPDLDFSLGFL